jgi:hypothetical protein
MELEKLKLAAGFLLSVDQDPNIVHAGVFESVLFGD